jgi:hypothetical protein
MSAERYDSGRRWTGTAVAVLVHRPVGRVGMYLCHACGEYIERETEGGKLKKWRKSYCEKAGKDVRIWLKLSHNMPHHHSSPNNS